MAEDLFGRQEIGGVDAAGVAQSQRMILRCVPDRTPDVDDGRAARQQRLGLVPHDVTHALRAGADGLIDMDAGDRLARSMGRAVGIAGPAPQGMVEDHDARSAGRRLDNLRGFRMAQSQGLRLVPEIANRRTVRDQGEAFKVQRELARDGARVGDRHPVFPEGTPGRMTFQALFRLRKNACSGDQLLHYFAVNNGGTLTTPAVVYGEVVQELIA